MNTHSNNTQPKELSDAEFEAALHAVLRDEGHFFPHSAEDVAALKANMDLNEVPTPDTEKFRQILRNTVTNILQLPTSVRLSCRQVDDNLEKLAMAARNGGEITKEIRERMDADRAKSATQIRKDHGAR